MTEPISVGARGEIRCFCSRSPLLGVYGVGKDGRAFVHVKVWKQKKLYTELLIKDGEVSMKCRDCYRWYRIFIKPNSPVKLVEFHPGDENAGMPLDDKPLGA